MENVQEMKIYKKKSIREQYEDLLSFTKILLEQNRQLMRIIEDEKIKELQTFDTSSLTTLEDFRAYKQQLLSYENNSPSTSLEELIEAELNKFHIPRHIKGYRYLYRAIEIAVKKYGTDFFKVGKDIYPILMEEFQATTAMLNRNFHTASKYIERNCSNDMIQKYFGGLDGLIPSEIISTFASNVYKKYCQCYQDTSSDYSLEELIKVELNKFHVPKGIIGYAYLCRAIEIAIKKYGTGFFQLGKDIYPILVEEFQTTSAMIEKNIHTVSEHIERNCSNDMLQKYFGGPDGLIPSVIIPTFVSEVYKKYRQCYQDTSSDYSLEELIKVELNKFHVPIGIKGYTYLCRAIEIAIKECDIDFFSVGKDIYPILMKEFQATSSSIERDIRTAGEHIKRKCSADMIQKYFGGLDGVVNSEIILVLADQVKNKYKIEQNKVKQLS